MVTISAILLLYTCLLDFYYLLGYPLGTTRGIRSYQQSMVFVGSQCRLYYQHYFSSTHSSVMYQGPITTSQMGLCTHSVLVSKLSVNPCLFDLLQQPILRDSNHNIIGYWFLQNCQSLWQGHLYIPFNRDTTPTSILRILCSIYKTMHVTFHITQLYIIQLYLFYFMFAPSQQ